VFRRKGQPFDVSTVVYSHWKDTSFESLGVIGLKNLYKALSSPPTLDKELVLFKIGETKERYIV
jgi:hypothetical protein